MTLLVAWIGIDSRAPASVYIVGDSRISWKDGSAFDFGRKVFVFRETPDIVGYCGDALFPSMAIAQLVEVADNGLLFSESQSSFARFRMFRNGMVRLCQAFPRHQLVGGGFQIVYVTRDTSRFGTFGCYVLSWSNTSGWAETEIPLPSKSGVLHVMGSGSNLFKKRFAEYQAGPSQQTSRAVFQCFCNSLFSGTDRTCGGAPQLVGIYRQPRSAGKAIGFVGAGKRYIYGAEIDEVEGCKSVEWRNELFERCDWLTMSRLDGAQVQPDPHRP